MTYLFCRNRVADFERWRAIFASHQVAHRQAGLSLVKLWQSVAEPDNIFFIFEVASIGKASEFIANPEASKAADASGVIDGEYHFLTDAGGY